MTSLRRSTSPVPRRFLILGGARSGKSSFVDRPVFLVAGMAVDLRNSEDILRR